MIRYAMAVLGVALGVVAVVLGGLDDSPGLQLIGVVLAIGSVVYTVLATRRERRAPGADR